MTYYGGSLDGGVVFSLTPPTAPGGRWTEAQLHTFGTGGDGSNPTATLVMGEGGVLYGTTVYGGANNLGMVFSLAPPVSSAGQSAWIYKILYSFKGGSDGSTPYGSLTIGKDGSGDRIQAKTAYRDFLTLWKDAEPDVPILQRAKAEYAKLAP